MPPPPQISARYTLSAGHTWHFLLGCYRLAGFAASVADQALPALQGVVDGFDECVSVCEQASINLQYPRRMSTDSTANQVFPVFAINPDISVIRLTIAVAHLLAVPVHASCGHRKRNEPDAQAIDLISTGIKVGVAMATRPERQNRNQFENVLEFSSH